MSAETKFTPGPWKLFSRNGIIAVMRGRREVIKWTGFDASDFPDQAGWNAALAAAGPDLYAALLTSLCPAGGWNGMPADTPKIVESCVNAGFCGCDSGAAIRKARGAS
jgi:hypothetical protein